MTLNVNLKIVLLSPTRNGGHLIGNRGGGQWENEKNNN